MAMGFKALKIGNKTVGVHKAGVEPAFGSKTVLVSDTWQYVEMWLKRLHHKDEALFYWEQARHFFEAARRLPELSSPLPTYYSFLNATKTLLTVKGQEYGDVHGVAGQTTANRTALCNEVITFKRNGVLAALCRYMGESANNDQYSLKDVLYNLPYVHRAYNLTFSSQQELFFAVSFPRFVRKSRSSEAWFVADVADRRLQNQHFVNKLPDGYERDTGVADKFIVRRHDRFAWRQGRSQRGANIERLTNYHKRVREVLFYIHGPTRLWYIKRRPVPRGFIKRCSLTLTYGAMHRLSELARYEPMFLARHFACQHNWLLSEFINTGRYQFIDEISSEITGQEFMIPGRKSAAP